VPASATAASVNPIDIGVAEPKISAKLLIQTNTSGCAALLSLPEAAMPGDKPQPPATAMAFSLAPPDPAAFESIGRNLGRLSADVLDPHNGIFILLFLLGRRQMLKTPALFAPESIMFYLYYLKPKRFNSVIVLPVSV
jgi:hypothetical protein